MSKVIGIAAEGPTDYLVLKTVIDTITGEDNRFLALQPEPDMMGRYGNGWKGVWKWCKENSSLEKIMDEIQPKIDVIIIQMDGDVVRKEKEVHCQCDSTDCEEKGKVFDNYRKQILKIETFSNENLLKEDIKRTISLSHSWEEYKNIMTQSGYGITEKGKTVDIEAALN